MHIPAHTIPPPPPACLPARPQVHGFPKVMGVLTHLDAFRDTKALKKTKKGLKHRFWTEIYQGGWCVDGMGYVAVQHQLVGVPAC